MYSVAFIGTGPDPDTPVWGESAAMAYRHAAGYAKLDNCDLVACADLVRAHAEDFAAQNDIPTEHIFEDYDEMLASVEPDIVSIATPVPTHADIVVDCADSGVVDAIHCEKPMATTWADCQRMATAAADRSVQLTFNHQRRFGPAQQRAMELLDDGVIGELERLEMAGKNIYDFGTHLIDLCQMYADESAVEWVMGQVDYWEEDVRYGAHNENQALAQWRYESGVDALASTGEGSMVPSQNRLVGTTGEIQIRPREGPSLRVRDHGDQWETVETEDATPLHGAIEHIVSCLEAGTEPVLSADHALAATEVIFATWESARRRGRIELPLEIEDNPLADMVESGIFNPAPSDD